MNTGLVADARFTAHDPGPGHPERVERFAAVMCALEKAGLSQRLTPIECKVARRETIERCHERLYLELAEEEILAGRSWLSTGDTSVCVRSWETALLAAGAGVAAVDAVLDGRVGNAFCAVRPPGHHATSNRGMGFCILNNVAIAARHAQAVRGVDRVAIVDWDVHHGNGTQDIFCEDGSVLFFSTHQWPLYPGTGAASERGGGKGEGKIINCPVAAGAGMKEIGEAFRQQLLPALDRFRPELILLSAGFDARAGDPLGGLTLTDEDFRELTLRVRDAADWHCDGRLVSVLEGGYDLRGLGAAAAAHVEALLQ